VPISRHLFLFLLRGGVLLTDKIKSLDWRARKAELIARLSEGVVQDILTKLGRLL
jgi:mRNA-degrading endonuclease toxin of MazEF toxin-antitoxin module